MKPDQNRRPEAGVAQDGELLERAMAEILRSIRSVRFGSVEITIHDSRVVQIERKEKVRLEPLSRGRAE